MFSSPRTIVVSCPTNDKAWVAPANALRWNFRIALDGGKGDGRQVTHASLRRSLRCAHARKHKHAASPRSPQKDFFLPLPGRKRSRANLMFAVTVVGQDADMLGIMLAFRLPSSV